MIKKILFPRISVSIDLFQSLASLASLAIIHSELLTKESANYSTAFDSSKNHHMIKTSEISLLNFHV